MTGPTPKAALAAVREHALSHPEAVEGDEPTWMATDAAWEE